MTCLSLLLLIVVASGPAGAAPVPHPALDAAPGDLQYFLDFEDQLQDGLHLKDVDVPDGPGLLTVEAQVPPESVLLDPIGPLSPAPTTPPAPEPMGSLAAAEATHEGGGKPDPVPENDDPNTWVSPVPLPPPPGPPAPPPSPSRRGNIGDPAPFLASPAGGYQCLAAAVGEAPDTDIGDLTGVKVGTMVIQTL